MYVHFKNKDTFIHIMKSCVVRRLPRSRVLKLSLFLTSLVLLVSAALYILLSATSRSPPVDSDPRAPSSLCHTPRCIAYFESLSGHKHRIPTIRHILWKNRLVSRYFAKQLKSWWDIHPDWKYVLWQDSDLEKFVAKHYPGVLAKFKSLPHPIMRVDMIRYMIMHRYGGVYADLDYTLVSPLDRFLKFPAVVTRETEAHSLYNFGMRDWPPPLLGNPAFLMSEPRNAFFQFCVSQLVQRPANDYMKFAGPIGLSDLLLKFSESFPVAASPELAVYIPASNSFYPYRNNNLNTSASEWQSGLRDGLRSYCKSWMRASVSQLNHYCNDVLLLDPLTDNREPTYAVHDLQKKRSAYHTEGSQIFHEDLVDVRSVLPSIVMSSSLN